VNFSPRFRAVSLDLWFTALYYPAELDGRWREARLRVLGDLLRTKTGGKPDPADLESALDAVHAQLDSDGQNTGLVDPQALVLRYAEQLDAELRVPPDRAGHLYSAAGLAEHPPIINPELVPLVRALEARDVPVVLITNTARRGATWQEFFLSQSGLRIPHVIASCEVGRAKPSPEIFVEASRRLGVPLEQILHVGDRWELDIVGALTSGCGAALYRGLWAHYPEGLYPAPDPADPHDPNVRTIERLDELLTADWLPAAKTRS
jgi:FMN phosphatase YigB (HAD superfamily)